jgi:NDP-sugar pyrophosphorylase family protein
MPMAGEGSRFVSEGWMTPKPLIEIGGIPLFKHALSSIEGGLFPIKYSFIVRQEHINRYSIDASIRNFIPDAEIFSVGHTTRGAVETCLLAAPSLCEEDAVLVMDCDLEFRCQDFNKEVENVLSKDNSTQGGLLVSFRSTDPRYSYAATDGRTNRVIRVAEKEPISYHALCGAYFFSSSRCFLNAARRLMSDGPGGKKEYYVSLLYTYLLDDGQEVYLFEAEEYRSYGTPEELSEYL